MYHSILEYTMEQSTIKLSKKIKNDLKKQMNHPGETYETVIARLLKNAQEDDVLNPAIIKNIEIKRLPFARTPAYIIKK